MSFFTYHAFFDCLYPLLRLIPAPELSAAGRNRCVRPAVLSGPALHVRLRHIHERLSVFPALHLFRQRLYPGDIFFCSQSSWALS